MGVISKSVNNAKKLSVVGFWLDVDVHTQHFIFAHLQYLSENNDEVFQTIMGEANERCVYGFVLPFVSPASRIVRRVADPSGSCFVLGIGSTRTSRVMRFRPL